MTQSLERIKLNYTFPGKDPALRVMSGHSPIWVERPGVGASPRFSSTASRDYFIATLDPRFAPGYIPDDASDIRLLTFEEVSGSPLFLSNSAEDAEKQGYINFRNNPIYIPMGVKLGPGDEFYRIRLYQKLRFPFAGRDNIPEPKIAAEIIIVYNPSDSDSWTSGLAPHRLMHAGVRHIQWQGYTYKTPLYDLNTGIPWVHTSLTVQGINIADLSQMHDLTNRAPILVIDIAQQDLQEDLDRLRAYQSGESVAS